MPKLAAPLKSVMKTPSSQAIFLIRAAGNLGVTLDDANDSPERNFASKGIAGSGSKKKTGKRSVSFASGL